VHNALATGRLLQFEVTLDSVQTEVVRLRTSDLQAAQEIVSALPTTRTAEFQKTQEEKRGFEQAIQRLGTRPTVTYGLVVANIGVFLLIASQGGGWLVPQPKVLVHWGSNFGPATVSGEWWRLFTSMFVHFGLVHLALNMWVLWSIGRLTERMFGSLSYALLYVFAGLCGSVASIWWHPNVNSAGASGAIFGLLGGLLAFLVNPATGVPPTIVASQRRSALVFIAYNLLNGFTHQGIDNACHLGGLVGGFLMGWMLAKPLDLTAREEEARRCALPAAFGMVALIALAWPLPHRPHLRADEVIFPEGPERHSIAFSPGQYEHVAMSSGPAVSKAMQAVHAASNATALNSAIAVIQQMAEAGDAEAAFRLGRFYHLESAEPNYTLALKYYEIAFNEHHAWATNNLGLMYRDGLGVTRDDKKALEYFQMASRQHNPWSYVNLADMSFWGRGRPADASDGIAWLEEGRENGCTLCLIEEAAIYHSGAYGIRPDRNKAVWLLNKAAALGDSQAKLIVAELHIVGDGVPQSSRKAFEILKALSDTGDGDASTLLGELSADDKIRGYLFASALGGVGQMPSDLTEAFPQDTATAMRYWERANQQGSCQSWIDLSAVYDKGIDVRADPERSADYIEQAVSCDPTNSFYLWKLAMRFFDAKGRAHDCEKAARFLTQSLDNGYADASVDLGYIYDKGCGPIARDYPRAFRIYLLGAKLGVALSQNNVGVMIKHGRGIPADLARGYAWIKLAALHGDELAKSNLQDPVFTAKVKAAGLADLAEIQVRLVSGPKDSEAILRDPWY